MGDRLAQELPAAIIAPPARHADMEIERQVVLEFGPPSGEAVRDAAGQATAKILENGRKIAMCIALMEEDRLVRRHREFQLCDEGRALRVRRRQIAEIVEAAFADRDHPWAVQERGQLLAAGRVENLGMMGVYAGGTGTGRP